MSSQLSDYDETYFKTLKERLPSLQSARQIEDAEPVKLAALLKQHKISEGEFEVVRQIMERLPTLAELGVFSSMWSEHCSYKSSKNQLKKLPTTGEQVVVGPGENAGVVRLSGKLCVAFKMESHNHPSYIAPYQGAATGVGGILRDVFCMGARPVANLNALRFGKRSHPRTHYIYSDATKGIGDYGNCVGIPTVAGSTVFDPSYDGNCLVNAMTAGIIHEDRIFKGYASGLGNLVVYVGSATGRDGIHGATMASDSFEDSSATSKTTIQVGDPFTEKLLLEATLEVLEKDLVIGLQDMGAAGLTSSSFEMADRAQSGLLLDLAKVPTRAEGMSAYELLLSESQERMLMVITPDKWQELATVLEKWELSFAVIGEVTDSGRVQIVHNDILEVDMPVGPLTDRAPRYDRPMIDKMSAPTLAVSEKFAKLTENLDPQKTLFELAQDHGSRRDIYRKYDSQIGVSTVFGPESESCGLLWLRSSWAEKDEKYIGLALAADCNESYCRVDAFKGGAHAVLKAARSVIASGAKPLATTDCLNFGNPEDPAVMRSISDCIEGMALACAKLDAPIVSGNVSLYNTTGDQSIAPTPMIGIVGKHKDVRTALPAICTEENKLIALLHPKNLKLSFGGSLLENHFGYIERDQAIPAIDWNFEKDAITSIATFCEKKLATASRDLGRGGLVLGLTKMLRKVGVKAHTEKLGCFEKKRDYFAEVNGGYLIAFNDETSLAAAKSVVGADSDLTKLGLSGSGRFTIDKVIDIDCAEFVAAYDSSLQF